MKFGKKWTLALGWSLSASFLMLGCTIEIVPPDGGGDDGGNDGGGGGTTAMLRVASGTGGGNFAVGVDEDGNEYSFRARVNALGATILTEANIRTADGQLLKVSLDEQGRPVNFRHSDNTAADLVYEGNSVRVRLTDASGNVIADDSGLDPGAARERAVTRRAAARHKREVLEQGGFSLGVTLSDELGSYEEIALSIFDDEFNPGSPLVDVAFREAALDIAEIVSVVEIVEVEAFEIVDIIIIDEVPDVLLQLAGQTFVLFDAEGFCLEETEVASRLTFDNDGLLQSEFDRQLVFPDLSLGGSAEPGLTINYSTGTPVNLTPEAAPGFELFVTPIFTGTQIDDGGAITIERRFLADAAFDADVFGSTIGTTTRLFDAALVNGRLSAGGDVLDVELILVDLAANESISSFGRLRYRNQNSPEPQRVFSCNVISGEKVTSSIICPQNVAEGDLFEVVFIAGRENEGRVLAFDWFVSDGFGLVLGDPAADRTEILAAAPGFLEVSLVVSDLSANALAYQVYTCGALVGEILDVRPPLDDLFVECPAGLNLGETAVLAVGGAEVANLEFYEWFVFGTSDYFLSDPFDTVTDIEIYQAGKFEIVFQGFNRFGDELFVSCEVFVGGVDIDECELNGFYGDGICDEFCFEPDPDCDVFFDLCEINGWYGDGECDDFCPELDPDCEGTFFDICEEEGFYGDGVCDLFCPEPDPDCDTFDICFENSWYGDGVCDDFCPEPDPDCDTFDDDDFCAQLGYYGDGRCDVGCPLPDPDCDSDDLDICEINEWYGDGECDDFCPLPDPDCS